jgi:hypothetical protein
MNMEATTKFNFDAGRHVYTLDGRALDGVTSILNVISKSALIPWAAKMTSQFIRDNCEKTESGEYLVTEEELKEASVAHTKKKEDGAKKGTDTHAMVEDWINEQINHIFRDVDYSPIQPFIDWSFANNVKFLASEKMVYSKSLGIAGTMDFLFEKDGKVYVGDLKTYKALYDRVPMLQCAAYGLMLTESEGTEVAGYCVFNLPKERPHNPEKDVRWSYDVAGDTKGFLAALDLYRTLKNWA